MLWLDRRFAPMVHVRLVFLRRIHAIDVHARLKQTAFVGEPGTFSGEPRSNHPVKGGYFSGVGFTYQSRSARDQLLFASA